MTTDQGPIVQSALLRTELVRLRKEKGMTQEQVANRLEWSPSKLIRVEGGKNTITRTDLQALLTVYDVVSESRQERLQSWARGAREPAWWNAYRGEFDETFLTYVGYTAGAAYIRHFHGTLVPGMLQTEEYAQVLYTGVVSPQQQAFGVKLRMQRQRELAKRDDPPRQNYIIDEAVIRRHVGVKVDPAIMPNQLRHIAESAEADELLTVRVIPFSAGAHLGIFGPFSLLEFEGGLSDVLYLEGRASASVMVTGEDTRIAEYRDNFETLLDEALTPEKSIALIRQAAEELMD
ncbi:MULTISPECIES: helix-turn-helix domain-containing protein [Actinomadura]|uniref:Helix-turn-helix domain-containing protein n=1 Tax=Actinomadura litoris TaxID=2678616 RepID=A0A7K1KTG1_9ACTN|nr:MULTISPECIES: helix-turn-helix transcriptional regulator [Actinomadura]MBT2207738.1 helix-turn-helix domain-containing protein [Actinomadura sp. NEAU-AAG7]MUN35462.1 helix-turn-helix domain-containing protein [Actinomadura litoris]